MRGCYSSDYGILLNTVFIHSVDYDTLSEACLVRFEATDKTVHSRLFYENQWSA